MARERNESGRYVETVGNEDVLETFDTVDGPVITSTDVGEHLECTTEAARQKLKQLVEAGALARRRTGRTFIYWRVETTLDEMPATSGEESTTDTDTVATTSEPTNHSPRSHGAESEAADPVNVGSLSFNRDLTPARREHLRAWLRYATDRDDGVSKSDFEAWWGEDRAAETGYNVGSFWEAFVKAAMKQSDQFTKPDMRTYRYAGDEGGVYDPTKEF